MGSQAVIAVLIGLPSAIWLIGLFRWLQGSRMRSRAAEPGFTVLVAARNEEPHIGDLLPTLLDQRKVGQIQVIVVDDHSTDRTYEIVEAACRSHANLKVIRSEAGADSPSPKKHSLQQGLGHVATPFVALTDADCRVPDHWLTSMQEGVDDRTGAVLGASFPPSGSTFSQIMYRAERLTANCVMASSCGWGSPSSACGHNLVYRTDALREAGGFAHPEVPSGDDDLTVQAMARKTWQVRFASSPSSVVLDCGGTGRASRWQSASRHQSVLRYYPFHWRAFFAWSVVSHIAALTAVFALMLGVRFHVIMAGAVALFALDIASGVLVARKLRLNITTLEIVTGGILLPFWTIWRAASALLGGGYAWRGRSFGVSDATGASA